jgi:hypothetical protein
VVRVAGTKLTWSAVSHARRYAVITVGRRSSRRVVTGTHFAPRATPGSSVGYRVSVAGSHARLSREVKISWPASGTDARTSSLGVRSTPLEVGVMNTTGWGLDSMFHNDGVDFTRLDVGDGSDLTLVQKSLADGITPLVLYNPGPGLANVSPATAAAQVKSLAQRLAPMGLTTIEFGNEVYTDESATTYAAQYAAAHAAIAGMGFKLLAVATAIQSGQDGYGDPTWIPDFIHALPGGASEVDAWTIHPYGTMTGMINNSWGWSSVTTWHNIAVAAGSTAPWYITEVGQCLGGSACNDPVSQATQAADMSIYLNQAENDPWVSYIDFYTSHDDATMQFGLSNNDGTPRPALTALQTWLTQNTNHIAH